MRELSTRHEFTPDGISKVGVKDGLGRREGGGALELLLQNCEHSACSVGLANCADVIQIGKHPARCPEASPVLLGVPGADPMQKAWA